MSRPPSAPKSRGGASDSTSGGNEENYAPPARHDDGEDRHPTFLPGHGLAASGGAGGAENADEHASTTDSAAAVVVDAAGEKLCADALRLKENVICSAAQLAASKSRFFLIQEVRSKKFLARPIDTNRQSCGCRDKMFRVRPAKSSSGNNAAFTIQGHNRMYLSFEHNDRLTVNRLWARSYEAWQLHFDQQDADGCVFTMQSNAPASVNNRYVSLLSKATRALETADDSPRKAARWRMFAVPGCAANADAEAEADACWGTDTNAVAGAVEEGRGNKGPPPAPHRGPLHDSADTLPELRAAEFPLFGSPKPLKSSAPLDPDSRYDAVVIAERTIRNWAAMDGMVPVMFSTDKNTVAIVDRVNGEIDAHNAALRRDARCSPVERTVPRHMRRRRTAVQGDFETMPAYKNNPPTYRGLFKRALEMFPDAPAVMYSNGDILFSPTLAQTIRYVASVFERMRRKQQAEAEADGGKNGGKKPKLRGWMIVGQRINYEVPARFTLKDTKTETYASCDAIQEMIARHNKSKVAAAAAAAATSTFPALDTLLPKWVEDVERYGTKGKLFQGNAEDYFIVSRDLFDWDKIPEFIVGGVAFDNWITSRGVRAALKGEALMVDAVKTITALHQNDDPNVKQSHNTDKSRFNLRLAAQHGGIGDGYTSDAPLATTPLPDGSVTIYDKYAVLFD